MAKKTKKKSLLCCPYCGCTKLVSTNTKIRRFPKTHLFKFECGFAYLFNSKTEKIYLDVDWQCLRKKNSDFELKFDEKKYVKLTKENLKNKK